jgi:hypothetical protein
VQIVTPTYFLSFCTNAVSQNKSMLTALELLSVDDLIPSLHLSHNDLLIWGHFLVSGSSKDGFD